MTKEKKASEPKQEALLEFFNNALVECFNKDIPFNKLLGLEITSTFESSEVKVKMKPELVGNVLHKVLHGGVIAAVLDVAGAVIAIVNTSDGLIDKSAEDLRKWLFSISTIDMRIDYLLPGFGGEFIAKGCIIRRGSKVAVVGTQLMDEKGEIIALGTATYLVG
ncbi:MAG: thioesterase family protein [Pseudomonadota bacterium]